MSEERKTLKQMSKKELVEALERISNTAVDGVKRNTLCEEGRQVYDELAFYTGRTETHDNIEVMVKVYEDITIPISDNIHNKDDWEVVLKYKGNEMKSCIDDVSSYE